MSYEEKLEHIRLVREAVAGAGRGEQPLTVTELAKAIGLGLRTWTDSQGVSRLMVVVAKELAEFSGEPVKIDNLTEGHEKEELNDSEIPF